MLTVERASADDVFQVALRMRERDFREFTAVHPVDDRLELARRLARLFGRREDVICGRLDEEPVCVGGTVEAWPNVATLLFFATDDFPRICRGATRFIKRELFPRLVAAGVHRIQALALDDYTEAHAWLETLGLKAETGPMKGYGKRGEAFRQFAMVVEDAGSVGA